MMYVGKRKKDLKLAQLYDLIHSMVVVGNAASYARRWVRWQGGIYKKPRGGGADMHDFPLGGGG